MIIAIWILAFIGLVAWSLTAWGLYALLSLEPANLDQFKQMVQHLPFGPVLSQWLPGWEQALSAFLDLMQSVIGWAGGAARTLVWIVWGVGVVLLAGGGGLLTLFVVLVREKPKPAIALTRA